MALSQAIDRARNAPTAINRARQHRAELRLEEIVKVAGIEDSYLDIDRDGDLHIETAFGRLYQACETEQMRSLVARTFAIWQKDEAAEEAVVKGEVGSAVSMMKRHNPAYIDGAFVPDGDGGAA